MVMGDVGFQKIIYIFEFRNTAVSINCGSSQTFLHSFAAAR